MASSNITYQKVSIKYGLLVGLAHMVFFMIMWALGLLDTVELSFISGLFLVIGICVAISNFKKQREA
ncbi:hypothetical protein [Pontibacter rugosus]